MGRKARGYLNKGGGAPKVGETNQGYIDGAKYMWVPAKEGGD